MDVAPLHFAPTWTDTAQFFDAFWPQLVATVAGIAMGIPIAFRVERSLETRRQTKADETDKKRLSEVCSVLLDAVDANTEALGNLAEAVRQDGRVLDERLHSAEFEMVRADLSLLPEAAARGRVAHWFDCIIRVDRHIEALFQSELSPPELRPNFDNQGNVAGKHDPAKPARDYLREVVGRSVGDLNEQASEVRSDLLRHTNRDTPSAKRAQTGGGR